MGRAEHQGRDAAAALILCLLSRSLLVNTRVFLYGRFRVTIQRDRIQKKTCFSFSMAAFSLWPVHSDSDGAECGRVVRRRALSSCSAVRRARHRLVPLASREAGERAGGKGSRGNEDGNISPRESRNAQRLRRQGGWIEEGG